jgi:hypothetical protein
LSLDNQRRQGGSEDKYSDLLIKAEGCTPEEVDMVVSSKKRDQGQQQTGNDGECALQVESNQHRSQPQA